MISNTRTFNYVLYMILSGLSTNLVPYFLGKAPKFFHICTER